MTTKDPAGLRLIRYRLWSAAFVIAIAICSVAAVRAADQNAKPAEAADSWLKLVDGGDYATSWQESSSLFQAQVSKDDWNTKVAAVRDPLGPVVSRKLAATQTFTSLPGVPDGHYAVMRFDTSFKNKQKATEVVTTQLDPDGDWRVAGYFIE